MTPPTWKTDAIKARIHSFCAQNLVECGNAAIQRMLLSEFHIAVTSGQVAGAVKRLNIERRPEKKVGPIAERRERNANVAPLAVGSSPSTRTVYPQHSIANEPKANPAAIAEHDRRMAMPMITAKPPVISPPPVKPQPTVIERIQVALQPALPVVAAFPEPIGPVSHVPARPTLVTGSSKCRFPLWGNNERPTHKFCGSAAVLGESWCQDHRKIVFERHRPMREVAA